MCGITGFVLGPGTDVDPGPTLRRMTDSLTHRGPDGCGLHLDRDGAVGLGHRRLAVVDLSEAGKQPMISASGRFVITYNGEVYNFARLRTQLQLLGTQFLGHSDTEVMLAAIEAWGIEAAVRRFTGMFAFALWDRREQELWLCRDRLGKKPLYAGLLNGALVFASELKSLRLFPGADLRVDRNALMLLFRHNYITAPWSIYESVWKLRPGCMQRVCLRTDGVRVQQEQCYWSAQEVFERGRMTRFRGDARDAVDELEALLRASIADRMVADVPLGAFLSGGIDSSTVVALMQAQSTRRIRTFSIGFREKGFDEAPYAAQVAAHLGTDHTEVYLSSDDALAVVPMLPTMFDEPMSDSSQIPTYLVSQVARKQVTVALSGDGGDELFCGYPRYQRWRQVWSMVHGIPWPLRRAMSASLTCMSVEAWDRVASPLSWFRGARHRPVSYGDQIHKLARVLIEKRPDAVYRRIVSHWANPEDIVIGGTEPVTPLLSPGAPEQLDAFTEHMMLTDILTYLPGDILAKVDRASMAVSLEARCPLLDHHIVEWAAALPLALKVRNATDKWVLRQVLFRYAPERLFERPKMGFGVPIGPWLRGPLRDWAEDLLADNRLDSGGLLNPRPIRRMWDEFLHRHLPWQYLLWDILMFRAWFESPLRRPVL